jgi:hypothetical protein
LRKAETKHSSWMLLASKAQNDFSPKIEKNSKQKRKRSASRVDLNKAYNPMIQKGKEVKAVTLSIQAPEYYQVAAKKNSKHLYLEAGKRPSLN